ncbi:MAG: primosomal protein N' [Phycisphaeraceae bacterium]|nr:primosomal protein N' [Phycisphaeraceae bacterium]
MELPLLPFTGTTDDALSRRGMPLVRVAVERGIEGEGLTYASPWPDICVGERVVVPLARGRSRGVVVAVGGDELLEGLSRERVKEVIERSGRGLPPQLVELARWIAAYYISPLGMVLSSMVPSSVKERTGSRRVEVLGRADAEVERAILAGIRFTPSVRDAWEGIVAIGPGQWPLEPRTLARTLGATMGPINKLIGAGLLVRTEREEVRARGFEPATPEAGSEERPEPNPEQSAAIDGIGAELDRFGVHLLFGVTGSGKTEVYLRLIERVIAGGRRAIVLVPEISLTPQTSRRFEARFGGKVAVLHSGLSASQRHRQWQMAMSGEAMVVVGARSAIFAPLPDLGLVVVDEEHDSSYKQDTLPRYHGRDVAIKRAQLAGCPVVLGSATPSLESWANGREGKFRLWTMRERAGAGSLPKVRIVDLASEQPWGKGGGSAGGSGRGPLMIGATLRGEIVRTLNEGGQAILLLNRRGFATFMHCPGCKWTLSCSECDAAMVLHRGRDLPKGEVVRCHHCRAERIVPSACELCGGRVLGLGAGTQRVEEEVRAVLQDCMGEDGARDALLRLDADSVQNIRALHSGLERFGAGDARVLLGTQMIAKGLDFPNVRLVGVISADTALHLPDFRASERTFQLVAQVSGRAGRGAHPGRVVVQTFSPHEPAIVLAARHDFVGFAERELAARRGAGLPPEGRMARIVVRDQNHAKGQRRATDLAETLRAGADPEAGVVVEGPTPCVMARIEGWHRWELLVRSPGRRGSAGAIQRVLGGARRTGKLLSDSHTAVDVDPLTLM